MSGDVSRFIKTLTFHKAWNTAGIFLSYNLSRMIKTPVIWGRPYAVSIEPVANCNLNCPECPAGRKELQRENNLMSLSLYKSIIDQIHPYTSWLQLFFQGEPFLHPDFDQFIFYAKEKRMYTSTSTNGHFLSVEKAEKLIDSGLDRIIISLDGADQETYSQYRQGGDFHKVIEGIRNLTNAKREKKKSHPYVILQFIVFRHNEDQINKIKKLGKKLHVNKLEIKTAQIYDFEKKPHNIPQKKKYSRYIKKENGLYQKKKKLRNQCRRLWYTTVIASDGNVLTCCFDKYGNHSLGNVKSKNVYKIWNSEYSRKFKETILKKRRSIEICQNCTE